MPGVDRCFKHQILFKCHKSQTVKAKECLECSKTPGRRSGTPPLLSALRARASALQASRLGIHHLLLGNLTTGRMYTYETTRLLLHVLIYLQFRSGRLCNHTRHPGKVWEGAVLRSVYCVWPIEYKMRYASILLTDVQRGTAHCRWYSETIITCRQLNPDFKRMPATSCNECVHVNKDIFVIIGKSWSFVISEEVQKKLRLLAKLC